MSFPTLAELAPTIHVHHDVIVDASQTPEEAWAELCEHGRRVTFTPGPVDYLSVYCDGTECGKVPRDTD